VAAKAGKFALPPKELPPGVPGLGYAYHFDAASTPATCATTPSSAGVKRTEGKIAEVELRAEDGFVEAVSWTDGRRVEGDFFIDCSGFRGLLIEQALKTGYEDWSHWLPCDRALAVPCERLAADALHPLDGPAAGWQWRIPLQHRTGNGYVYCSAHISDDEAAATLLANLDGKALADPRPLRFTAGRRKKSWNKNVVALGLAGGFMEPLESTSIHLIQSGAMRLLSLLPMGDHDPAGRGRVQPPDPDRIRADPRLHHPALQAPPSGTIPPLWNYCRTMAVPDSLSHKIELFRSRAKIARFDEQLFAEPSWLAVFLGQGITPRDYDRLADVPAYDEVAVRRVGQNNANLASRLPSHDEFIAAACRAEPVG
jgi:tryptophan halogenase